MRQKLLLIFLLIGGAVLALFLFAFGLLRPVGDILRRMTMPLVRFDTYLKNGIPDTQGVDTDQRLQELEQRIASLSVDFVKLRALEEEVKNLRAQTKFLENGSFENVGARVIRRKTSPQQATIVIDRGEKDGVELGQAVMTGEGIFVGKVVELYDQIATVQLIADPQSRVTAASAANDHLVGVVEGRGSGTIVLTFVPSNEAMSQNQLLMTAGLEEKIPAKLPFGVVSKVEGKSTDPYFTVYVDPLVDLSQLLYVSILKPVAKPGV